LNTPVPYLAPASPLPEPRPALLPLIASIEMGYGHMRAAHSLAQALDLPVMQVDQPPDADDEEQRLWRSLRRLYEVASRTSQLPLIGAPLRSLLDAFTAIAPLHPYRDLSAATLPVRSLDRLIRKGLGKGLVARLRSAGSPLLTTFFAPAIIADLHHCEPVYCVVTDVDIHRIWVPRRPERARLWYLTPSRRALKRLRAYGVARERIELTGFPLPLELLGGRDLPVLRRNLAARLVRLDRKRVFRGQMRNELQYFLGGLPAAEEGRPPLATFAVGGAGAQAELARELLASLRPLLLDGRLRLCLAAGVRLEIAERFRQWIGEAGLAGLGDGTVSILAEPNLEAYFARFNELLGETDILWTKPSELTFYAALGLPLVLTRPLGMHERYNLRWAIENGAALAQRDPRYAGYWIKEWLAEGTLAAAAWSGFTRLPKFGTYQILDRLRSG
jgi:hypothetical protein